MKFNIEGRMRNMRLPDGRTALLFAVYEAVSNGVHAIEERFGNEQAATSGHISIFVKTDAKKQLNLLSIRDNGVGLRGRLRSLPRWGERRYRRTISAVQEGTALPGGTPCGQWRAGRWSAISALGKP
jgi:hypothetical protein